MPNINILSFEVANLIAAGEVVDRPASAIKEMIENSIDAGARHVTIELQNGGITFMRISDDGCGMEPDDLPLAIKRHATSKIRYAEDLDGISTLGFRGEALAAISAVSDIRIISKTHDAEMGAELEVHYGEPEGVVERGCSSGTTIVVENLFANVPARRKFLKRDVTETMAVCANVERIALSHPEIAFRLICDGQVKLETAGDGKLMSAIYAVFGRSFASKLIEVNGEYDGINVSGYIGRSDNVKGNRNYENFYINKRLIKSRTASAAIEQAYTSYMPIEKFPVCVLSITLNPSRVDVNVHPAKLEVKFSNEKPVFEAVYYAVKQALEENTTRPEVIVQKTQGVRVSDAFAPVEREQSLKARQIKLDIPTENPNSASKLEPVIFSSNEKRVTEQAQNQSADSADVTPEIKDNSIELPMTASEYSRAEFVRNPIELKDMPKRKFDSEEMRGQTAFQELDRIVRKMDGRGLSDEELKGIIHPELLSEDDIHPTEETISTKEQPTPAKYKNETPDNKEIDKPADIDKNDSEEKSSAPQYKMIGEAFNSYIIVELEDKLLLIDKHAAHERIIFEDLKSNMYSADVPSQLLMLPIEVMLMSDEVAAIEEYRAEIEAVGFDFTTSRNIVQISSLPMAIEQDAVADMFAVIADRVKNGTGRVDITRNIIFEKALYQASCKAAIKAGREYPEGHQKWIVDKLMQLPDITFCPHGRPVAMELKKKNIDRQFERT